MELSSSPPAFSSAYLISIFIYDKKCLHSSLIYTTQNVNFWFWPASYAELNWICRSLPAQCQHSSAPRCSCSCSASTHRRCEHCCGTHGTGRRRRSVGAAVESNSTTFGWVCSCTLCSHEVHWPSSFLSSAALGSFIIAGILSTDIKEPFSYMLCLSYITKKLCVG